MRSLALIMSGVLSVCFAAPAFSQGSDPFGSPAGKNPKTPDTSTSDAEDSKNSHSNTARDRILGRTKRALAGGKKPVQLTGAVSNDAEMRIKSALDDETAATFIDTPLREALQTLSETHDIPIIVDRRALEEIGLDSDAPVTIDLRNISLRSLLRLMLRDLDLTYLIKDEVLQITTTEAAEENLVLEMYVLPENLAGKSVDVVKVLVGSVAPDAWETLGGNSTAMPFDHVIVVSATSDLQQQTSEFLNRLIEKYGKK